MSSQDDLAEYQGRIVSQSYNVGFVALSCLVSFIGAASTLELINHRTGFRGLFNNLLLASSAVTMGGVSIWSMHYIANRAMELASGEQEMQISYSPGFTVLSFFVPIVVLLAAFVAVGSNDSVSWWRVSIGGIICGGAVCGMHYLGNASISNYHCTYRAANVAGSAIIAVTASTASLSMFFVFRAMWANSWWKRIVSAVILAGAVSGMHWCAALGTRYRFVSARKGGDGPSRNDTVIVVICLAIGACFIIAGSAVLKARNMSKSARKAQQITLAAAVFDKQGRMLVDINCLLPSTVVTHSFLEKSNKDAFSVSHPLFHWMFQATRNWAGISSLVGGMKTHLSQLPHSGRDKNGRLGIDLIDNLGQLIDDYDVIFRELFCVAALALAERLREQLTSVGVLWDEILPTGTDGKRTWPQYPKGVQGEQESTHKQGAASTEAEASIADIAEKGGVPHRQESGSGSLMILVRRVRNDREVDRLVSAGYRFAEVRQVAGLIGSRMQIQSPDIESKLRGMATYTDEPTESRPKVSLGFFGIKARIDNSGFDVLVQRMARDVLPSTSLSLDKFEAWHLTFLKRFGSNSVSYILQELAGAAADDMTPREKAFASQFANSIRDLRRIIQDPLFDDAVLTPNPVNVPYLDHSGLETTTKLLALRLLIPIHGVMTSPSCEFIPLSFFKARALSQKQQLEFMQGIHRELGPVIKDLSERAARQGERGRGRVRWSKLWRKGATSESGWVTETVVEGDDKLISTVTDRRVSSCASLQTDSTAGLYPPGSGRSTSPESDGMGASPPETRPPAATVSQPFSGILVSQEVTVDDEVTDKMDDETYGYPSRLGTWVPPVRTGQKATATLGIEMGSVRHVVTGTQTGGTHVIGGWDTDLGRTETFVDSLFAQCVLAHKIAR